MGKTLNAMTAALTRRDLLRLLTASTALALVAAACGSTNQPSSQAASSPTGSAGGSSPVAVASGGSTQAAGAPKSGGTLRMGVTTDITRLDIHYRDQTHNLCYDELTAYDANWKPIPSLAENWDVSPDGKQVTFHLRKGVQFHDGREMTSDDVKWSYQHAAAMTDTNLLEAKWWTQIDTPDNYTVIMKSAQPRPMMFDSFFSTQIVDKNSYDAKGTATNANGTGPFKLANWKQGLEQDYEKNKNYWKTGQPYFDRITVSVVTDIQALTARLEAGGLDALPGITPTDFLRLKADTKYAGLTDNTTSTAAIVAVNTKVAPWTNKRAREALFYTINRDYYAKPS